VKMRLPDIPESEMPDDMDTNGVLLGGALLLGEGSLRLLGSFIVWLCLLHSAPEHPDDLSHPQVVLLISSMLKITTFLDTLDTDRSTEDALISRIIRQNKAAKTQPVTSFAWSMIMLSMSGPGN